MQPSGNPVTSLDLLWVSFSAAPPPPAHSGGGGGMLSGLGGMVAQGALLPLCLWVSRSFTLLLCYIFRTRVLVQHWQDLQAA